jgi:hypothetical protein
VDWYIANETEEEWRNKKYKPKLYADGSIPCQENLKAWLDARDHNLHDDRVWYSKQFSTKGVRVFDRVLTPSEIADEYNKMLKEEDPMKTLFNVIVITKQEEIILDKKVVAEDVEEAKFNTDVSGVLREKGLKPKDVTIICNPIGQVKIEKEPQKVQLVKE